MPSASVASTVGVAAHVVLSRRSRLPSRMPWDSATSQPPLDARPSDQQREAARAEQVLGDLGDGVLHLHRVEADVELVGGHVEAHQLAGEVLGVDELVAELLLVALRRLEHALELLDARGVGAHGRGRRLPRAHHLLLHHLGELLRLAEQGAQLRQGFRQLGLRQLRRGGVAALGGEGRLREGGAQAGVR